MKEIRFAFPKTIPIFFAYVFLGIAYGIMMTEAGMSPLTSIASSVFVYAGSLQIVMVSFLKAGVPLISVAVMAFFVNARHMFYGLGFIEKYRKAGWRYPYLVFGLTDETYSILCSIKYDKGLDEKKVDFWITLINQSYWVLGTVLGTLAGAFLPFDLTGIDFSASAFFLVVVVDQFRECPSKIPVFTGLLSALLFYFLLGPDQFLIPALSLSLVVLVILRDFTHLEEKKHES